MLARDPALGEKRGQTIGKGFMQYSDILIVGGGMVGSALAAALSGHGLSIAVLEQAPPARSTRPNRRICAYRRSARPRRAFCSASAPGPGTGDARGALSAHAGMGGRGGRRHPVQRRRGRRGGAGPHRGKPHRAAGRHRSAAPMRRRRLSGACAHSRTGLSAICIAGDAGGWTPIERPAADRRRRRAFRGARRRRHRGH